MIPAALLLGLGIDVAQSSPDAQVAVSDHQRGSEHAMKRIGLVFLILLIPTAMLFFFYVLSRC